MKHAYVGVPAGGACGAVAIAEGSFSFEDIGIVPDVETGQYLFNIWAVIQATLSYPTSEMAQ